TVLITTHYMDEAQRLCDRVAIVSAGKVLDTGIPADLIANRLEPETVEFDCTSQEEVALLDGFVPADRPLRVGQRLMLYVNDAATLIQKICSYDPRVRPPTI